MTGTKLGARSKRAQRRDERRARILAIVEQQLRGGETFADLKVGRIVAEAGISRTTFYVYFEDKTDLLRTWYADVTEDIIEAARTWWELDASVTREKVRAAIDQIVQAYRPHPELMAATHEATGYDQGVRDLVRSAMERYIDGLTEHLVRGQRDGFIDATLPPAESSYWLQWMAERGLHRMGTVTDDDEIERLVDAYAGIVWNALYAPVSGGPAR
ncbi:TetR/AcrR family transcriptional regulator [Haloechinothrix salitolerans]|uniref:TetR/AcrR family transcriptional regulator n=1 Tax=Haloechinothrix salitolerans TaxID=926830 RepID=A0ABW2BWZ9_9PSEU